MVALLPLPLSSFDVFKVANFSKDHVKMDHMNLAVSSLVHIYYVSMSNRKCIFFKTLFQYIVHDSGTGGTMLLIAYNHGKRGLWQPIFFAMSGRV